MTACELLSDASLREAAAEYRWLLERGFPDAASLKLVGDKHRLSRIERNVLFRGVAEESRAGPRRARLVSDPRRSALIVDAHNVSLTVLNYRLGHPVFVCTDGLARDAGGAKRRVNRLGVYREVLDGLVRFLAGLEIGRCDWYFDGPFSGSATHASFVEEALVGSALAGRSRVAESADRAVVVATQSANEPVCLCSGDSEIIDRTSVPLYDLSRAFIASEYGARLPSIRALFP